jgi:hypothetical protein
MESRFVAGMRLDFVNQNKNMITPEALKAAIEKFNQLPPEKRMGRFEEVPNAYEVKSLELVDDTGVVLGTCELSKEDGRKLYDYFLQSSKGIHSAPIVDLQTDIELGNDWGKG